MNIEKFLKKIEEYDTIIIHRHRSPDIDAIGSQMALKTMLRLNYPNKNINAVGEVGYEQFSYIGELDTVKESDYQNAIVIVVDTANYPRIDDQRFKLAKEIIKIDHHQDLEQDRYGDLNIIVPSASSTSEVLYMMFEAIKAENSDFKMNSEVAKYLFAGIYSDTGGFIFPNTSTHTFRILSEIVKYEFDYEPWVMKLRVLDEHIVRLIGYAMQNIDIEDGIGVLKFDTNFQKEMDASPRDLSIVVNYMGMFKNLKAWVVFNEHPKFIRVNLRSRNKYDVSAIASQYDGGGHKNASGAMVKSWDQVAEIKQKLLEMVQ